MRVNELIHRVLASGVLSKEFTSVASRGATDAEIAETERQLAHPLSDAFKGVVREWNGLHLDWIRIFGVGEPEADFDTVLAEAWLSATIGSQINVVASDPDGFLYGELVDGSILKWDHDGGRTDVVATSFEDFIGGFVFGPRSADFAGEDWLQELRSAGIIAA